MEKVERIVPEKPEKVIEKTGMMYYDIRNYKLPGSGYDIKVCGLITGCGAAQIYGLAMIQKVYLNATIEVFDQIKKDSKQRGIGAIIGTMGHYSPQETKDILTNYLGFEALAPYHCWHHNITEMQTMYILRT